MKKMKKLDRGAGPYPASLEKSPEERLLRLLW